MYKIQPLVESGYDFAAMYAEKQEVVRNATGLEFNLSDIVKFLQRQTNNFTLDNNVAHDLDNAIYETYLKFEKSRTPEIEEVEEDEIPTPKVEKTEEEERQELIEAIELLEMLGDDADEEAKEALEILKTLI